MGLAWMDVARYGDSSVFHADGKRDMWPWRDWVIRAYNANKPFNKFTIEQLAGDLLPDATIEQTIATGFHRNNATTDEGGAIPEEYRIEYAVDRVKTTSMAWLGLSMECGQCHDHKYDPISQQEYYQFFAYFNQASDPGMQIRSGNQAPIANVPNPQQAVLETRLKVQAANLEQQLKTRFSAIQTEFEAWVADASARSTLVTRPPTDMLLHFKLDELQGDNTADTVQPERLGTIHGNPLWGQGKLNGAFQCDGESFIDLGDVADFERTDSFSFGAWIHPKGTGNGAPIARMDDQNSHRGFDIQINEGQVGVHIIHAWPDNAIKVLTENQMTPDQWQHVFATYDGSGKATGIRVYFDGQPQALITERDNLRDTIRTQKTLYLGRRNPGSRFQGLIDDLQVYARVLSESEVTAIAGHNPITPILATPASERTEPQREILKQHYLNHQDETYQQLQQDLTQNAQRLGEAVKPISTVMVMQDVAEKRMTYILDRGNYATPRKDQPVEPGVPGIFPPPPSGAPANRLGMAQWLTQPTHPLTARVAVNRYWQMLFGTGLVQTVEDFGSQGDWPSHPALLDWLAVDFIESGWDIKRMVKQIVLSATYQQTSRTTEALQIHDPHNRLLARGPRFRLQGELLRDNALAASGLLVHHLGGPSVKPYQPPGLWNEVSLESNVRFVQDQGEKLYRRSMYTFWKRSAPAPSMTIFDAPSREKCTIRRSRTNTPLQALVTLNDPQFVEAARMLAQRVIQSGGSLDQQITLAYRLATGIRPKTSQLELLKTAYAEELAIFQSAPKRAEKLLAIGESVRDAEISPAAHAAMTVVTSMILNLDETLTRG